MTLTHVEITMSCAAELGGAFNLQIYCKQSENRVKPSAFQA